MRDRVANETSEERETRLQHMSNRQHERLTAESSVQREVRQQLDRAAHQEAYAQQNVPSKISPSVECVTIYYLL